MRWVPVRAGTALFLRRRDRTAEGMEELVDVERDAVRAILLTPNQEVLLLRIFPPEGGAPFWITPGGGTEPGETPERTLKRELMEELGLAEFVVGPIVWRRQHTFNWGDRRFCQREQFHIVHVDHFDPVMRDETEAVALDRFQWWPVAELAGSPEELTPLSLARIVEQYLAVGPPQEPLEVEVLVD